MLSIKKVLMERDGMTIDEANRQIEEAKVQLKFYNFEGDLNAADGICQEMFGLEPDYILELL